VTLRIVTGLIEFYWLWDLTPCSLVGICPLFETTCCLSVQYVFQREEVGGSTLLTFHESPRLYIPKQYTIFRSHCCCDLKHQKPRNWFSMRVLYFTIWPIVPPLSTFGIYFWCYSCWGSAPLGRCMSPLQGYTRNWWRYLSDTVSPCKLGGKRGSVVCGLKVQARVWKQCLLYSTPFAQGLTYVVPLRMSDWVKPPLRFFRESPVDCVKIFSSKFFVL
jgi:hypothetical protein